MPKIEALHFIAPIGPKHSATVIFFHSSGSTGHAMMGWVQTMLKNFTFNEIKVMYPTAPLQPFTMAGGKMSHVWFDRSGLNPQAPELLDSIASIETKVKELIKLENDAGIPSSRIIVGGFSMGGSLSYHTAYRWDRNLAGVFVFGSFLYHQSIVYDDLKKSPGVRLPPLLQLHGDADKAVDLSWAKETFDLLRGFGVEGEFHVLHSLGHFINRPGMIIVKEWIEKILQQKKKN